MRFLLALRRTTTDLDLFGLADGSLMVDVCNVDWSISLVTVDTASDPQSQTLLGHLQRERKGRRKKERETERERERERES